MDLWFQSSKYQYKMMTKVLQIRKKMQYDRELALPLLIHDSYPHASLQLEHTHPTVFLQLIYA